ncbi:MAG TPA: D-aminoacylase [Thermodesulfovibrionales bacterium]|nr:D-aminoacylase [Thermodesulfovibrionales bacterium]
MAREIDLFIKGAMAYDGSGGEPVRADIGIAGDRIAFVTGPSGRGALRARHYIEAKGLSVCPGFIDTHAHSEFTLLADGRAEGKVLQGVTTEVNGNCGLSAAPLYREAFSHREKDLRELEIEERWATFHEYFALLEARKPSINFATLAGHGNLRASVIGYDDRRPSGEEMESMRMLLRDAVGQGAIGLSTGLIYPPGVYADTLELVELAKSIPDFLYASHMRSEGDALIEAIEELLRIGRESGIAVHVSHLKTGGRANWHKIEKAIEVVDKAKQGGLRVSADRYPYTAASTDLDAVLPSWTYAGGAEEELRRLQDGEIRAKIREEVLERHQDAEYWDGIVISSLNKESNKWMEGKTLSFLAEKTGKGPVEFLFDLLINERLRIGAIFHSMSEENLERFLSLPHLMIGSDSSARSTDGPTHTGKPHPRGFGTFPRFIGRYARDRGLMSVTEAIRRVTMLAATTFGLKGRGQLREGFYADLVLFDEEKILDRATFEEPFLTPEGIRSVIVNGVVAARDGAVCVPGAGRVLRHGR